MILRFRQRVIDHAALLGEPETALRERGAVFNLVSVMMRRAATDPTGAGAGDRGGPHGSVSSPKRQRLSRTVINNLSRAGKRFPREKNIRGPGRDPAVMTPPTPQTAPFAR